VNALRAARQRAALYIDSGLSLEHHANSTLNSVGEQMTFYKGQRWKRTKRKKHTRAKGKVRTTAIVRNRLRALRIFLAEQGYQIYPVALWFRRSRHDFVAAPREHPNALLVVRPTVRQVIECVPYTSVKSNSRLKGYFDAKSATYGKVVWGRSLPAKNPAEDWRTYISRNCLRELHLFTNA